MATTTPAKRPTLRDIARKAGCSVQAVSCILNPDSASTSSFSQELRDEVNRIAREIGYMGRGRNGKRSERPNVLVVVESSILDLPHSNREYAPLAPRSASWDYTCHMRISDVEDERSCEEEAEEIADLASAVTLDGILCLHHTNERLLDLGERLQVPVVFVNPNRQLERNCVLLDDCGGARMAMRFLQSTGCRRIAYVGARIHPNWKHQSVSHRRETVQAFAAEHGLDLAYCLTNKDRSEQDQLLEVLEQDSAERTMIVTYGNYGRVFAASPALWSRLENGFGSRYDFLCLSECNTDCCAYLDLGGGLCSEIGLQRVLLMRSQRQTSFANMILGERLVINRPPFCRESGRIG